MGDERRQEDGNAIVEGLGDMLWVRDHRTHDLLYVSQNARTFLGLSSDVPYGSNTFFDAIHPDDRPRVLATLGDAPDSFSIDFRFYRGAEVRWAHTRARFVYDESGQRARLEGCTSDITDRIRRQEALAVDAKRADTLARLAEKIGGSLSLDETMRIVCEETARALGSSASTAYLFDPKTGELVARYGIGLAEPNNMVAPPYSSVVDGIKRFGPVGQIVDVLALPDLPYTKEMRARGVRSIGFAAIMRGEEVFGSLSVVSYGTTRELTGAELQLLSGIAGQVVGPLMNAHLYADLERAEAKLRDSEQRYRSIVEATQEGICVLDDKGVFLFCNRRFAEMFDLPMEAVVGTSYRALFGAPDVVEMTPRFEARIDGATARIDAKLTTRTGRDVWYTSTASSLEMDGKKSVLVVATDITETRRLSHKLQNAQKAESLAVLAGGVAHDFNNLLVSMLGNAGFALMELPPESAVRGVIEDIQTAAQRASELTRQLLAYSGRGRFVIARLDLGRLVEEMAHLLSAVISKNVIIKYALGKNLPMIEGDATQVRQIVMNLITNASDAIGAKSGIVTIATSLIDADRSYLSDTFLDDDLAPGFYVCLEVSDTGCGMTPETRGRIFDPFFSTKFTGRGLGLAAVIGILRAHRGAIKVYSEPGRGSTFKVLLPAVDPTPSVPRVVPPTPSMRTKATVLVVDDDPSVRAVIKRILAQQGFVVMLAGDGTEAVDVYKENRGKIDVVILDVTMPNMGGEETFRHLRQIDPTVRVLLASGYSEQEATSRFAGKGLAGFVAKPFTPSELLERVRGVLEGG